jgi:hypothetical protein
VPTIFLKPETVNTKTEEREPNSTRWRRLHNDAAAKNSRRHFFPPNEMQSAYRCGATSENERGWLN